MTDQGPMSEDAAEKALHFLLENADKAGEARAQVVYFEHLRKSELARLKRESPEKTDAAKEAWARSHPDYDVVLKAQWVATKEFEKLSWLRTHAEATLESFRTKSANQRGAGRV